MKFVKRASLLLLSLIYSSTIFAQTPVISGVVLGPDESPLGGVSVTAKGTSVATTTNGNGEFTITLPSGVKVLVFTRVGMDAREINVSGRTTIHVTMEERVLGMGEVVVIGYGTQRKSDVTGSIATVKGEDIAQKGTVNISQGLQGLVSGVTVVNTTGRPGAGASILIRGQGSYGDIDPLYVVDGAITDNIDFIDPNDIASLDILKDASAAAIYGSRAANGVVIVTTKRGKSGKTKVTLTSHFGVQSAARKLKFANSQQWRDKEVWKNQNEGLPIPEKLQEGNFDPSVSTDWQDIMFNNADQQNYNLSFSGGGEDNNFNFSMGYTGQDGIWYRSKYDRINLRLNSDFVAGKFRFGESLSANRSNSPGSTISLNFRGWPPPVFAPRDADGNFQLLPNGYGVDLAPFLPDGNPLAYMSISDLENSNINIVGNVYAQFNILRGLYIRTSGSTQWNDTHSKTFTPEYQISHLSNPVADLNEQRAESYNLLWENTLNFKRTYGDHNLDAVVGWTRQMEHFNGLRLVAEGFPGGIEQGDAASTILPESGGNKIISTLESYLGRLNYSFKNRYQLTASIRQDASSRLIKSLRTGTFPSFSLGWVVSEEPFFPKESIVSRLKFRGGYGELGRVNSVGEYQTQNTLSLGGRNIDYILGSDQHFANGITIANITNSNILWERAKSTNIAMEAGLLDGKIFLTAEYFVKNTQDLQFSAPIPYTAGTVDNSILVNAGDIQNKGFELTMGYRKTAGAFTFNTSLNLYKVTNKVISFNNPDDAFVGGMYGFGGQNATRAVVGREMSNFWLLRTDGIFQSQAEIDAYSKNGVPIQPFAKPGDLRFKDINGDGKITTEDKEFIKGSIPSLEYGINFNGAYRNFDVGLLIQGVMGAKLFNGVVRTMGNILEDQTTNYWREDNPGAKYFRPSISDPNGNMGDNDFYLENSSYMRVKNIQIGYTLPHGIISRLHLQSIRVSITGQNLLTVTPFTGYDPESVGFGLDRGVNTNVYPLTKAILFGLIVNF